jgi:hypothetical protein
LPLLLFCIYGNGLQPFQFHKYNRCFKIHLA